MDPALSFGKHVDTDPAVGLWIFQLELSGENVESASRLFEVDTWAKTRDGKEAAVRAISKLEAGHHEFRHRSRKPHRARQADGRTDKTFRSYANDFEGVSVNQERLAEYRRAPTERALPKTVAQHGDGVLAVRALVLVVEETAMDRGHAQDGKVAPAHHVAPDTLAACPRSEVQRYELVDEHARKEIRLRSDVTIVREGEARVLERVRQAAIDPHELIGLLDGELLEQERLYEGKRDRVGADA